MHTDEERSNCKIGTPIEEDVEGPMSALPGCNPLQPGPADATVQTDCAGPQPANTAPKATNFTESGENASQTSA